MTSMEIQSGSPVRFESTMMLGIGLGVLFVLITLVLTVRRILAGRRYQNFSAEKDQGDDDSHHSSASVSLAPATKWAVDATGHSRHKSQHVQNTGTSAVSDLSEQFDDDP